MYGRSLWITTNTEILLFASCYFLTTIHVPPVNRLKDIITPPNQSKGSKPSCNNFYTRSRCGSLSTLVMAV